jgi:outer membrane protein assembly factor BamB
LPPSSSSAVAAAADASGHAAPVIATPRSVPPPVEWSELAPEETIARTRQRGATSMERQLVAVRGQGPEPFGVATVTDVVEVWTPSRPAPIASRPVRELARIPELFQLLASAHGLLVVENESEVIALDAETLATRWRHPRAPEERRHVPEQCAITSDLVVLHTQWWPAGTPPLERLVGIEHSGAVRFVVPAPPGWPSASGERVYVGGGFNEGLAAVDGAGAVRWRRDEHGRAVPVGEDVVVDRDGAWQVLSGATGTERSRSAAPLVGGSAGTLVAGAAGDGDVVHALVRGKETGGVARLAFVAWDPATGKTLWSVRERASLFLSAGDFQVTRAEVIYLDAEDRELVAIDRRSRAEKWHWNLRGDATTVERFVFANDGQVALYAQLYGEPGPDERSVRVFRPGLAPAVSSVQVKGRVVFEGRPVAGAAVRARDAFTRSSATGAFSLTVRARGPFQVLASARGIGPQPCRSALGSVERGLADVGPAEIPLQSDCDSSDE